MRAPSLLLIVLLVSLARPAIAAPGCDARKCVTTRLSRNGHGATLLSHCDAPVHCNVCASRHGRPDRSQCVSASVDAGGNSAVAFKRRVSRVETECFDLNSMDECRLPRRPVPVPPAPTDAKSVAAVAAAPRADDAPPVDDARIAEALQNMKEGDNGHSDYVFAAPAALGGWAGVGAGKFTLELLAEGSGTPSTSDSGVSSSSMFFGGGVRFALQAMGAPDNPGPDTTWLGVRVGMGVDVGAAMASASIPAQGFIGAMSTSSTDFGFQVPLFLGFQMSLGSFDSSSQWTGWTIGLDYQPRVYAYPGTAFAPVGFNIHLASTEYQTREVSSMHPHLDFNLFLIAPVNVPLLLGGSVGVEFQ